MTLFIRTVTQRTARLASAYTQLSLCTSQLRLMSTNFGQGATYEHLLASSPAPGVALITLNRPKALNALCSPLMVELNAALDAAQADAGVGAVVITGSAKAFAAGADIKEMQPKECESSE